MVLHEVSELGVSVRDMHLLLIHLLPIPWVVLVLLGLHMGNHFC